MHNFSSFKPIGMIDGKVDFKPLYAHLEKLGDIARKMNVLQIAEDVYTYAIVYAGVNEAEDKYRIQYLTEQNIKIFTEREELAKMNANLEQELIKCRNQLGLTEKVSDQLNEEILPLFPDLK